MDSLILAIESSCDESALALFSLDKGMQGEWVHTQIDQHQPFGGIVPELASREHLHNFPLLLREVIAALNGRRPDQLVVTQGPGLAGCLALGVSLAKALALAWNIPLGGANHLRGHAWSPFIALHASEPSGFTKNLQNLLPHLGLIVSGGNTILFEIDQQFYFTILAETVDDAAGEALDKGAKLLGMPYPGGPLIEKAAATGQADAFAFPRAFMDSNERRFSFSGLKTSLRYLLEKLDDQQLALQMPSICASYQAAVVDALSGKTRQILRRNRHRWRSLGLSGGVSNNITLRSAFTDLSRECNLPLFLAHPRHTGDNAGMIAFAAAVDPKGIHFQQNFELSFSPSLDLLNS